MNFIEQAKVILQSQDGERVAQFLKICDGSIPKHDPESFGYMSSREPSIQRIKGDIKALKRLKDRNPTALPQEIVDERIREFEACLDYNNILKTGGKPTDLTQANLVDLFFLREYFRYCFPDLSMSFGEETVLRQLAVALVGKPIPKSVGAMIDRAQSTCDFPDFDPP